MSKINIEETFNDKCAAEAQEDKVLQDMESFNLAEYEEDLCYNCGSILNLHNMFDSCYCNSCVESILTKGE